jgi:hypothetical protein
MAPEAPVTSASWVEASAQADAIRVKAAADAAAADVERQLKEAEAAPKIAAAKARAEKIAREAEDRRRAEEADARAAKEVQERREEAARRWRNAARAFAIVCAVVALPLQVLAFYSPAAPFLVVAPLVLEGGAWVLLTGAASAIEDDRPSWHYRLVAGVVALFAAWINWSHGHEVFGTATGMAGAFCSLAGPAVWDLHEHGRIAKKAGKVSRRERRRQEKEARRRAEETARKRQEEADRREQQRQEDEERYEAVAQARQESWSEVWDRAAALADALGETRVSDAIWRRAWFDTYGTDLGETAETIAARVAARARAVHSATTPAGADEPGEDGALVDGAEPLSAAASRTLTSLGRKGQERPAQGSKKAPQKPITEELLAAVRAKAAEVGGTANLSLKTVKEAVGGGNNEWLKTLRDLVQQEAGVAK